MLKNMQEALRPGGWFACMFHWDPIQNFSPRVDRLRKLFAYLSMGNMWYEPGDVLHGDIEFVHRFGDKSELASEFAEGGFAVPYLHIPSEKGDTIGMALLHKA